MGSPTPPPLLNPSEVQVGTANGPGIWIAPSGTEPPDTTAEEFEDPWEVLGYLSDDGPTVGSSTDSEDLTPWQSVVPIRSVITGRSITLQFVLWQLNERTLAVYFDMPEPTAGSDGSIDMELRSDEPQRIHAIAIDSRDAERVLRISFTRASLTSAGDMAITRGSVVPLDCTLSALDNAGQLGRVQLGAAGGGTPLLTPGEAAKRGASASKAA